MSERTEVTKVVENIDRLFSEIVVNGESHISDRYVPPEPVSTPVLSTNQSEDEEEQTVEQNDEPVQGEYVKAVELNNVLHDFNDEELAERVIEVQGDITRIDGDISDINNNITGIEADIESAEGDIADLNSDVNRIDTTIGNVQTDIGRLNNRVSNVEGNVSDLQSDVTNIDSDVDTLQTDVGRLSNRVTDVEGNVSNLQSDVTDIDSDVGNLQVDVGGLQSELTTLNNLLGTIQSRVNEINTLIPNQASAQNQLADKRFVNSSIASNTANFLGTYDTLGEIMSIPNPTNNDYAFLHTTDSVGNTVYERYKYNSDITQWLYEYDLNNSSFTAEQWATINSRLTQSSVAQSILNAINALDVASAGGVGKYISEIQESNGKIQATERSIASAVTSGNSSPVSSNAVAQAITNLCANAIGGSGKYIATLQQTNGKVLATEGTFSNTVQSGDYAPVTSNAVAQAIANASISAVDTVVSGCMSPVTSNAVANWCPSYAVCAGQSYCVMDYCSNTTPLYVGYAGAGLTCAQVTHLVAFSTNYISGKTIMKDASKETIQSWLGLGSASYASTSDFRPSTWSPANVPALSYTGAGHGVVTAYQTDGSWCGSVAGWASYLVLNHGDGETYYNQMIRMPFWGTPQYQRKEGGTNTGWYTFITDENIGAQSVNYATSAGSAGYANNAGALGGYGFSTSVIANCIVQRDGNGYIYGNYFNADIGDENINSYGGVALIFSGSDKWLRRTPPSYVCVGCAGSANCASATWYGSTVFCVYTCNSAYFLCNRCNFPAIFTPPFDSGTPVDTVLRGASGRLFQGDGSVYYLGGCNSVIGCLNKCYAGVRVY